MRERTLSGVTCPSTSPTSQTRSTRRITRSLSPSSFQSPTHRVSSQSLTLSRVLWSSVSISVSGALEVYLYMMMRYINQRFTYLLT